MTDDVQLLAAGFAAGVAATLAMVRTVMRARRNGWSWPPSSRGKKDDD